MIHPKIIAPSLFSADMLCLQQELDSIRESGGKWIHLDVMDGSFVPNFFLSPKTISDIRRGTNLFLDTHLMIEQPQKHLELFTQAGASSITVHYEAHPQPKILLDAIHQLGLSAGVALVPQTAIDSIFPLLTLVDLVLVMSIQPGIQGQSFQTEAIGRVQKLDAYRRLNHLSFRISVDGAISEKNAPALFKAGADVLVVGRAFFEAKDRKAFIESIIQ